MTELTSDFDFQPGLRGEVVRQLGVHGVLHPVPVNAHHLVPHLENERGKRERGRPARLDGRTGKFFSALDEISTADGDITVGGVAWAHASVCGESCGTRPVI
ncbi:hypothetical protein EVAR_42401_1 [Eumeta japonica]|uniref:Uncharacterized protein n=1 Tax=Eumeta variegata TaxID=151549 RepID=A0A4C1X6S3_EUMVA|nr:hypothetical protein EVAR_42401_1 [Eumeta japonica]